MSKATARSHKTWVAERLPHVEAALGNVLLPNLTEERIREYMKARKTEGAGGRTVNMEVSMLARAMGRKVVNPVAEGEAQ